MRPPAAPLACLLACLLAGGCGALAGAASDLRAASAADGAAAQAASLLVPRAATAPVDIQDLVAGCVDRLDTRYDAREMIRQGLDARCVCWERLVAEGRIAAMMQTYFCRPAPRPAPAPPTRCPEPAPCPEPDLPALIRDAGGECWRGGKESGGVLCQLEISP